MAETTEHNTQSARGNRRRLQGRVVNDTASPGRAKKTVIVEVVRRFRDPVYGKYIKAKKKYHAHDEREEYMTSDLVEIRESRPISATKRWVVTRLLERPEKV
ncbi:MAG: 30S ribosomal protein S17 [Myxococcales bacterium]|nr:30S ribosomal protein S17 [Myxococcales bacterium]MDD9966092.1 30S ribosomal protein S17 [Myxococcales bacterium]